MNKTYPVTLQSLPLLNEPATIRDRRLCLRQLEENKWCVCTYHEQDDEFVQGHYYNDYTQAYEHYCGRVAEIMEHYQELVDKFYEMERV